MDSSSANTNDGGDLSVTTAAAATGTYGMQAVIDDTNGIYVSDDSPTGETLYRARFYFDPNGVVIPEYNQFILFRGDWLFGVDLKYGEGEYKLVSFIYDDFGQDEETSAYTISDDWHLRAWGSIGERMTVVFVSTKCARGFL